MATNMEARKSPAANRFGVRRMLSKKSKQSNDASTPVIISSGTKSRDDLYTLPPKMSEQGTSRPSTADGSNLRTRKRIHVADLIIDQTPRLPTAVPHFYQKPAQYSPSSIGIAIGSPTHWPMPPSSYSFDRPAMASDTVTMGVPSIVTPTSRGPRADDGTNVVSKRKLFSTIFGRKSSGDGRSSHSEPEQAIPYYRYDYPSTPGSWRPTATHAQSPLLSAPATPRWNTSSPRSTSGLRPVPKKSYTTPGNISVPPLPPPKDFPVRTPTTPMTNPLRPPLLKVDIPDIKMERYSVMFGDVLKPQGSLLARRSKNLSSLQVSSEPQESCIIHEELIPVRRATLPSPRSPRFSLFPLPPSTTITTGHMRSPALARSNTLPSPSRQNFHEPVFPKRKDSHHVADSIRSPSHGSETPISIHSDWQSEDSIDISDISEEDFENDDGGDIIIQLGDVSTPPDELPPHLEVQDSSVVEPKRSPALTLPIATPRAIDTKPVVPVSRIPRALPLNVRPHEPVQALLKAKKPPHTAAVRSIAGLTARPIIIKPTVSHTHSPSLSATNKSLQYINPLQSSPATATEITIARQLSLSKRNGGMTATPVVISKTPKQSVAANIVDINPDDFPVPARKDPLGNSWRVPSLPGHMRNKSEHIVLDQD